MFCTRFGCLRDISETFHTDTVLSASLQYAMHFSTPPPFHNYYPYAWNH